MMIMMIIIPVKAFTLDLDTWIVPGQVHTERPREFGQLMYKC